MPKMTAKYRLALATQRHHNGDLSLPFDQHIVVPDRENQEALYQALNEAGYFWDSGCKEWEYHEPEQANNPTPLIKIRVWAAKEAVQEAADNIIRGSEKHLQLIERSEPYRCRPPQQREAHVYLSFLPKV